MENKIIITRKFRSVGLSIASFLMALSLGLMSAQAQLVIDWNSNAWDTGTFQNGATLENNGISATVNWAAAGSTDPLAGDNLTVSTVLSGGTGIPSLRLQQENDRNSNPSVLTNFSTLTIEFSTEISLATAFTVFDVDQGSTTTWIDFIFIEAFSGGMSGTPRTVAYTPTVTGNELSTQYSRAGVLGTSNILNTTPGANVGVSIMGTFDFLRLTFTQSSALTSGSGSSHGIGISNISSIPEPSTSAFLFSALGVACIIIWTWRRAFKLHQTVR